MTTCNITIQLNLYEKLCRILNLCPVIKSRPYTNHITVWQRNITDEELMMLKLAFALNEEVWIHRIDIPFNGES